uniref:D-lactate dehydrogenase (cytochrome) n=1 Tax=Blastobotrys adeninivorans TaxID=409370 RepID=A0A060T9L5_BLAAD
MKQSLFQALRCARPSCGRVGSRVPKRFNSNGPKSSPGANSGSNSGSGSSSGSISLGTAFAVASVAAAGSFFTARALYRHESRSESIERSLTKPKYGTKKEFEQALPELEAAIGKNNISTDEEDLKSHGYSEWSTYNIDQMPIAIAYPSSTEEVSKIAKICHKYKLPMIGFSGGSSLEGHFCAPHGGICIDFANMDKILQVRPDDMDCTVQPSVGWMDLNEHLAKEGTGLFFAVDPGPTAKIGGMVATSCSGTNCVRYGPMRNHVINLTVVLADGTVIKTRGRPRKTSAGYNLNHLFSGSEGTLGLITEITVKLEVVPEETAVAICSFPTVKDATSTAIEILRAGIPVNAVELMDDVQMWAVNKAGYTDKKYDEKPTLFFKFSGTKNYVKEQIAQSQDIAKSHGSKKFEFARDELEKKQLWSARKELLWSMMAQGPPNCKAWSTDVAVPISRLADLVETTKKEIVESGILGGALGHVGDGNFHSCIIYAEEDEEKVRKLCSKLVYHGLDMEGTCTGEHGIGAGKMDYLADEVGADAVQLMRTIKLALDPHELLNPGKLFTTETIERRLAKERATSS